MAPAADRTELTVATFNIWNDAYFAEQRYQAIADLLQREQPDVMVFQEVNATALDIILAQPWIRRDYLRAAVTGGRVGDYGLLMLSRIPMSRATYTSLPTRMARGYLLAHFDLDGTAQAIVSVHLDSGKAAQRLRGRQLRRLFAGLRPVDNAVVLGDFNMRDTENGRLDPAYRDVWPALRPHDAGFTEDTSINLMRLDAKGKHRQVRFDRILVKGRAWAATGIELLGKEPVSAAQPRVFPSDHFGVACRLEHRLAASSETVDRRSAPAPGRLRRLLSRLGA